MKVRGKVTPLRNKIFVSDMEFGEQTLKSGLVLLSDNSKREGVHPRWAKVWATGPEQEDVVAGEWVLVEHGRWTRTIEYENSDGSVSELRMIDNDAILLVSDSPDEQIPVVPGLINFNTE